MAVLSNVIQVLYEIEYNSRPLPFVNVSVFPEHCKHSLNNVVN